MARRRLQEQLDDLNRDLANEVFHLRTKIANLKPVSPQGERTSSLLSDGRRCRGCWRDGASTIQCSGPALVGQEYCLACAVKVNATPIEGADPVNHPSHYTLGGIEVIEVIEAWQLSFNRGNAVKYLARAGRKDPSKTVEDLQKAIFYVEREISLLKREKK
jgi:hypothetical protein